MRDQRKLPPRFYRGPDVIHIARRLVGCHLVTRLPLDTHDPSPVTTAGMIVETEAYAGPDDRASHAYGGRRTARTETMFQGGGIAYVYRCYGIHALFNVVTNVRDIPHAVLIRAIEPTKGVDAMRHRRDYQDIAPPLVAGPGRMTQALGITTQHDGTDLRGTSIWIEQRMSSVSDSQLIASARVGVQYAGDHAARPWRFRLRGNRWTSPAA
ncbi:MAG: DNA-3-methyladenine glycosylase [Verrucomicrobia bacterium]|nr:DNA-3-methyladenine glycosylase [Verrucomicrobiota bacterium]